MHGCAIYIVLISELPGRPQQGVLKLTTCSLSLPRCSSQSYWLSHFQSLLYCSENNQLGDFSEELHSCSCQYEHSPCQLPPPCSVGEGSACAGCAPDNQTRCGSCNPGFALTQGVCRPMVADSTENYLGFETDLQDLELGYLLQRADRRLEVRFPPDTPNPQLKNLLTWFSVGFCVL